MILIKNISSIIVSIIVFTAYIVCSNTAYAEEISLYQKQLNYYGEKASQYIDKIEGSEYQCVFCTGNDASVSTATNVRSTPEANGEKITVLEPGKCYIKIWGYVENGWSEVCYLIPEDGYGFGYIRTDLLTLL